MRLVYKQRPEGLVAYRRWRDSNGDQRFKRVGVVWAKRSRDGQYRDRRNPPEGALTIKQATDRAEEIEAETEASLAEQSTDALSTGEESFETVALAWLDHGEKTARWKPSTVQDRRHTIHAHLSPAFGSRPVRAITPEEIRAWWEGLHDPRRKAPKRKASEGEGSRKVSRLSDGPLSDRNANKLLAELRACFNFAAARYGLASNPTSSIKLHRQATTDRPAFYSPEEIEALVRAAESDQDALAFRLAAYSGLRRGELVSLRWRSIDFARSSIYCDEAVSGGQDSRTKSGKGRTIPMARVLSEALAKARPDDAQDDDLVLVGAIPGEKLDGSALRRRFIKARVKAKLPEVRFHDLRHTFGSVAVDGGASLVQVQAWLGHADLHTTMIYLHTKSRAADAELLDRAFTAGTADELAKAAKGKVAKGKARPRARAEARLLS